MRGFDFDFPWVVFNLVTRDFDFGLVPDFFASSSAIEAETMRTERKQADSRLRVRFIVLLL